jgi:hypothetical protein
METITNTERQVGRIFAISAAMLFGVIAALHLI